jgi:hypothetical protein
MQELVVPKSIPIILPMPPCQHSQCHPRFYIFSLLFITTYEIDALGGYFIKRQMNAKMAQSVSQQAITVPLKWPTFRGAVFIMPRIAFKKLGFTLLLNVSPEKEKESRL